MKTQVLKPGYLVSLKTTIRGGVSYARRDITAPAALEAAGPDMEVTAWETVRIVPDVAVYEAAKVARNKARSLVVSVCCPSSFGLLCPQNDMVRLEDAIEAARDVAAEYNKKQTGAHVDVFILTGHIAANDAEADRAISSDLRDLLDSMQTGIAAANPIAIREAANKARALGAMLSEDVQGTVSAAIAEARRAARAIVSRVEKSGETAAAVVAELKTEELERARFAFLDMDAPAPVTREAPAAVGLDLEPAAPAGTSAAAPAVASFALEF